MQGFGFRDRGPNLLQTPLGMEGWALYQYVSGSVSVGLGFAPNFRIFCYREIGSCDSGH